MLVTREESEARTVQLRGNKLRNYFFKVENKNSFCRSQTFLKQKKSDENFILEKIYINLKLSPGYEAHFLLECKMVSVYFLSFSCFKKILCNKKASFRVNLQMIKIKSQKMCLCIWSALVSCNS